VLSGNISSVPSVYLISAKIAMDQGNYALALLDSDYISTDEHGIPANNAALYNDTASMINSSRFGSWATQFADEAMFYMNESSLVGKQRAHSMLSDGYYAALLGTEISNSTQQIHNMLTTKPVKTTVTTTNVTGYVSQTTINIIIVMLIIIIALLLATLFVAFMTLSTLRSELNAKKPKDRRTR